MVIRDPGVLGKPTFSRLTELYENYQPDVSVAEDRTRDEKREEEALLDEMMKTKVMKETFDFLKANGLFTKSKAEFENLLSELWFSVYSRGKRIKGSSGFEHVFLGEKKNGAVQGFHNWVYFNHLEKMGEVNSFNVMMLMMEKIMRKLIMIEEKLLGRRSPLEGNGDEDDGHDLNDNDEDDHDVNDEDDHDLR